MLFFALGTGAAAYELRVGDDGEPVRWAGFPVDYSAVGDRREAFEAAFQTWERVPEARVRFRERAATGAPEVLPDEINVVFFDPQWPWGEALGMSSAWMTESGEIVAFDIQLNPDADWSTAGDPDAYDVEAAVLHEIGHVLGIEHAALEDATMYAEHGRGETWRRALHADDVAAASFLYPSAPGRAGPVTPDPEAPPGSWLSGTGHCDHAVGGLPAACLALTFARRRRTPRETP